MTENRTIKIALAQISPVWLNKIETTNKVLNTISEAAEGKNDLVVFGEGLLPGYPFWVELTNGATFNNKIQKELYAHYAKNSIDIENGDLTSVCKLAREKSISVYLGIIERAPDRGGHSLYATLVYINKKGKIKSVHRKLCPTYEERLAWSPGDGYGLRVHPLGPFTVGGLNCWENWMPLSRTALYGQGENLHIAVWPGSERNTKDITRFMALEGRSFVVSVGSLMERKDFPSDTPHLDKILENCPEQLTDGGSCVAGPDGNWILEPQVGNEGIFSVTLDFDRILEERQNFDASGHYSRPDVTRLVVNRKRQSIVKIKE